MKYEDSVRRVCGENWKTVNKDEKDGGYGLACVFAFMRGVRPTIPDLASHLQVSNDEISAPYQRLMRNGIFSNRFNAKRDPLLSNNFGDENVMKAWATIAGIAGGLTGL